MKNKKEHKKESEKQEESKEEKPKKEKLSELEQTKLELQDTKETLLRLQADFENFRKRTEIEKSELSTYCKAGLLTEFLTIVDTFEIALKSTDDHKKFLEGVELIYSQMMSVLKSQNIKQIEQNKTFDPHYHEILMRDEKEEGEDNKILDVLQKGYMLGEKVLRTTKVKVLKLKEQQPKEESSESQK